MTQLLGCWMAEIRSFKSIVPVAAVVVDDDDNGFHFLYCY
jgi:hypothetical protein